MFAMVELSQQQLPAMVFAMDRKGGNSHIEHPPTSMRPPFASVLSEPGFSRLRFRER
jgi:hypothetical protein